MDKAEKYDELIKVMNAERDQLVGDDRLMEYKPANVFSNAPLALIQMEMTGRLRLLDRLLRNPVTPLPKL